MRGKSDKRKFTGERQQEDEKNKLRLNEFHRFSGKQQKQRKPTLKKRVRDLKRLLEREGVPEEIKTQKKEELRDMKKQLTSQKAAVKFETRYKKIKFVGKLT